MDVLVNTRVVEVKPGSVEIFLKGENKKVELPYGICVWATGIQPPPLIEQLIKDIPKQTHSKVLLTDNHLRVLGVNNVFAMGDCSTVYQEKALDHMMELFTQFDKNGDKQLSDDEFSEMMKFAAPIYPQLGEYAKKAHELFLEADTSTCDLH
jgi:pyruvate/2-oxoglutarate dehydrogenase complex dihydrolipoamide dehydrogenase (E3) component